MPFSAVMNRCHICGRWGYTERHHIFGGANRRRSERDGLVVNLCVLCHREGKEAVHRSAVTMQRLHEEGQRMWMERTGGSVEDFRRAYGKSYL